MASQEDRQRMRDVLTEAVTMLCKNGLKYSSQFSIEGLLGITLDDNEVFLVNIKETVQNSNPLSLQGSTESMPSSAESSPLGVDPATGAQDIVSRAVTPMHTFRGAARRSRKRSWGLEALKRRAALAAGDRTLLTIPSDTGDGNLNSSTNFEPPAKQQVVEQTSSRLKLEVLDIPDDEQSGAQSPNFDDSIASNKCVDQSAEKSPNGAIAAHSNEVSHDVEPGEVTGQPPARILADDVPGCSKWTAVAGPGKSRTESGPPDWLETGTTPLQDSGEYSVMRMRLSQMGEGYCSDSTVLKHGDSGFIQPGIQISSEHIKVEPVEELELIAASPLQMHSSNTWQIDRTMQPLQPKDKHSAYAQFSIKPVTEMAKATSAASYPTRGRKLAIAAHSDSSRLQSMEPHPFTCPQCNKKMSGPSSLRQHLKWHRGIFRYHCELCGKGFSASTNLKGHMAQHANRRPYKCHLCRTDFIYRVNLQRHMGKVHGDHNACDECKRMYIIAQ